MADTHYLISDASRKVDVESHVLRYWEEELEMNIPRNEMGHRYYTELHIRLFKQIKELKEKGYQATHVSISIECLQPKISPKIESMRESIGHEMGLAPDQIGITATTGEQLTDCGSGMGVSVLCILTVE